MRPSLNSTPKSPNYYALVPAAGSGSRMQSSCPKQYLPLHGKPILQHTLERLCLARITAIVVCVAVDDSYWKSFNLSKPLIRVNGGTERCHSVLNGLRALQKQAQPSDWVLVHDAARPCVRTSDVEKLMTQLAHHPVGGLLAVPVRDTMKRVEINHHSLLNQEYPEVKETVNRSGLWHALTPQMFRLEALLSALQEVFNRGESVTDDAQAMERVGHSPVLVEGHPDNIKITHPQDLALAELYLTTKNTQYAH